MIFDTDVLIWAQRGKNRAAEIINHATRQEVSIISYMEFIQNAQTKKQLSLSKQFFQEFGFITLPVTADISHRAAVFIEHFSHSHGLRIPDALIAATAFEYGIPLATANTKHYTMIKGLELVKLTVE